MHPGETHEFSMDKKNMADETAVKFKSKLRHRVDSAKVFDSAASWSNSVLDSFVEDSGYPCAVPDVKGC